MVAVPGAVPVEDAAVVPELGRQIPHRLDAVPVRVETVGPSRELVPG
jgi:hypothetical protein